MITHLHVKSGDDSLNSIAVIGRTIFVENCAVAVILFFRNCWKSIPAKLLTLFDDDIYVTFSLNDRPMLCCGRLTHHGNTNKNYNAPPPGDINICLHFIHMICKHSWLYTFTRFFVCDTKWYRYMIHIKIMVAFQTHLSDWEKPNVTKCLQGKALLTFLMLVGKISLSNISTCSECTYLRTHHTYTPHNLNVPPNTSHIYTT